MGAIAEKCLVTFTRARNEATAEGRGGLVASYVRTDGAVPRLQRKKSNYLTKSSCRRNQRDCIDALWKLPGDRSEIVRNQGIEADVIARGLTEWERKIAE